MKVLSKLAAWLLVIPIRVYQLAVAPMFAPCCRFYPSCSNYMIAAIRTHGCLKGVSLGIWRLLRCNPWNHGGVDRVPEPR